MKKFLFSVSVLFFVLSVYSQNNQVKPGIVGQKISDFTLLTYQGQELSIDNLRGKNVLLIVSRGKYADDRWCTICQYQYADYADLALTKNIREKYNLEIVFLFPYSRDTLKSWEKVFPTEMQKIEKWKNPDSTKATAKQMEWAQFARANYPKKFDFTDKKVPLPLPVLVDEKQEVSKGLDVLRMDWDGCKTMQNIPAVYIIDKEGTIRFKYISQNTTDRPTSDYIMNFIEKML